MKKVGVLVFLANNPPKYDALIEARDRAKAHLFVPTGRIIVRKHRNGNAKPLHRRHPTMAVVFGGIKIPVLFPYPARNV